MLSRDELRELWAALHETEAKNEDGPPKPRLSQTLNDAFLVMLLTAWRCGEVCRLQWRDVSLDTGWWLIPGDVSNNHDPHRVPLDILRLRARAQKNQRGVNLLLRLEGELRRGPAASLGWLVSGRWQPLT